MSTKTSNTEPDRVIDGGPALTSALAEECRAFGVEYDEVVKVTTPWGHDLFVFHVCKAVNGTGDPAFVIMRIGTDLKAARRAWPRSVEEAHQEYYDAHGRYPRGRD